MLELDNVWIPLADGARLAARVWMPDDAFERPVPAVLEYLPYRKSDGTAVADRVRHPYFAEHGYAAVRVDLRGSGDSDGLLAGEYLQQEQDDALEVLAWLAAQPWCTGAVGMIGYSWGGFNGLQIAARRPPELKAVITIASTDDRYLDDCHYMGGCLLASDMLKWATSMLAYTLQPPDPRFAGDRWQGIWLERLENAPELARDWVSHQLRDAFWKHGSVAEDYGAIQCPVMVAGGWADAYTNAVPRLMAHLDVPRLGLIGPWGHMMPYEGVPGPAVDFLREAVRWWDTWLKGRDTGIMAEAPLRIWMQDYVAPAGFYAERPGRWIAEPGWPPPDAGTDVFSLRPDESLAAAAGPGARPNAGEGAGADAHAGRAPQEAAVLSLRGRQECGETAGVWCANGNADEIAVDQGPDDERSLCFTTAPLEGTLEVLGFPVVRLRLSGDRPQALVAVRLEDVAPDGASLLVSWGMLNVTHRAGHEEPVALEPGRPYDVVVELRVCGHRFAPGHRLRLALSPTYWPHAWPSPEVVTLAIGAGEASVLELPVRRSRPRAATWEPDPPRSPDLAHPAYPAPGRLHPPAPHDERTRRISFHPDTRLREIIDHEEHARTVPDTGARYTDLATDIYSIVEDEPLSATVRCMRETCSSGPAADWRVVLRSEMTCDAETFGVTEEYSASLAGSTIFTRKRSYSIPRQGV